MNTLLPLLGANMAENRERMKTYEHIYTDNECSKLFANINQLFHDLGYFSLNRTDNPSNQQIKARLYASLVDGHPSYSPGLEGVYTPLQLAASKYKDDRLAEVVLILYEFESRPNCLAVLRYVLASNDYFKTARTLLFRLRMPIYPSALLDINYAENAHAWPLAKLMLSDHEILCGLDLKAHTTRRQNVLHLLCLAAIKAPLIDLELVRMLLHYGADSEARDVENNRPVQLLMPFNPFEPEEPEGAITPKRIQALRGMHALLIARPHTAT